MEKGRLEAFSDGVLAIIITIMVLELKAPNDASWAVLAELFEVFASYALSFVYVGIYWNNHHHLLKAVHRVSAGMMWANLHLLFWLSLTPFATAWVARAHHAAVPITFYGIVLMLCGAAYYILQKAIIAEHGSEGLLGKALGSDIKGRLSVVLYAVAIVLSLWWRWIAFGIYVLVAIMWLVPDRRIAKALHEVKNGGSAAP